MNKPESAVIAFRGAQELRPDLRSYQGLQGKSIRYFSYQFGDTQFIDLVAYSDSLSLSLYLFSDFIQGANEFWILKNFE